jgi:anti-sigma regulatory factor (Ser/Thr protein kinase)
MNAREAPVSSGVPGDSADFETAVCARFPAHINSPREARHFVSDVMREWGCSRWARDEAALVVTELSANAVLHAESEFSVLLRTGAMFVHIAVQDAAPVDPTLLVVRRSRGLGLVDAISRDWGIDVTTYGKTVWAEIDVISQG